MLNLEWISKPFCEFLFTLLTNSEYNFLKKGQRFAKIHKTFTKSYLGEAETGLNGVADEGTGKEKVLIFWISLRLTFSSNPKWTAKFFRLVNKLSSETERFDLSSKYLRAFFTMAARLAFAFSLTCSILSASDSGICKSTKGSIRHRDQYVIRHHIIKVIES